MNSPLTPRPLPQASGVRLDDPGLRISTASYGPVLPTPIVRIQSPSGCRAGPDGCPQTPNPKNQTPNPKPQNPNPKPQTLNPKPQTRNRTCAPAAT
jgi:hypothetical protein